MVEWVAMSSSSEKNELKRARIRVLHVITDLNVGGAERSLQSLILNTDLQKFQMRVISVLPEGVIAKELLSAGVVVVSLNVTSMWQIFFKIPKLLLQVFSFRPNIIHGWMYHGSLLAWLLSKVFFNKVPGIWGIRHSLHDYDNEKKSTRFIIKLLVLLSGSASKILYNSKTARDHHEAIGFERCQGEVIPNGYDTQKWKPDQNAKEAFKQELGIDADAILVGLIARFDKIKDHACFLAAADMLNTKHNNVVYILVGKDVVENNNNLKLDGLNIAKEKIYFLGERYDIPKVTASLDVAISSSRSEAFSNAVAEAMCCGVPCVATDVGDSFEIIGDTGFVVPPKDPKLLFEAMDKLLSISKIQRKALGILARKRMIAKYASDKILNKYCHIYESKYF